MRILHLLLLVFPVLAAGQDRPAKLGYWKFGPVSVVSTNEVTGAASARAASQFTTTAGRLDWNLRFLSAAPPVGHTVTIDFPLLSPALRIFSLSERGVMNVEDHPTYEAAPYGKIAWGQGRTWVLPLVTVMDPATDRALTIAFPPDTNLPDFQVSWRDARVLRLTLRHRAIGKDHESPLHLLFLEHAADYRAALRAYSDLFPAYFNPVIRKPDGEGSFYYHHIQAHPDYAEMDRQRVRYLWSSFWFTHLGEYLPAEKEWAPYTYAKQWKLAEMMNDAKINGFLGEMHKHGIETYAYFNVTEYGGSGGKSGNTAEAARILRERFANALMRNEKGADIPTWEGAMAMNASSRYALWPFLEDQVNRHLTRLPAIAGFIIDRLDWASRPDYGHSDGLSMDGARPFENMALPVAEAVQNVCRLSHAAGKRVFVNQFYRIDVLRDTDGVCHEYDYLPALAYLTPLRPASAWQEREKKYQGDLLRFEAQMKRRLQWALFPQMIAHQFDISQQKPDPQAADMQELYAPLFDTLLGKRQVLEPHPVEVTGANDVNLFVNGKGYYVVPVTSRTRFLSRQNDATESVTVRLRATGLEWAQVYRAGAAAEKLSMREENGWTVVDVPRHGTASVVMAGKGVAPALPAVVPVPQHRFERPAPELPRANAAAASLAITGEHVGIEEAVEVRLNGRRIGTLRGNTGSWPLNGAPPSQVQVELRAGDEGAWFVPRSITLKNGSNTLQWNGAAGRGHRPTDYWYQLQ